MEDELTEKIAEVIRDFGFKDVKAECGTVYYTELDGTRHRLVEDTFENDGWVADNYEEAEEQDEELEKVMDNLDWASGRAFKGGI